MQIFVGQLTILQIFPAFRIFIRYRHCADIKFPIFFGVFFEQGSRPRMWASTPWALCRTDRLSTIDYRLSHQTEGHGHRSLRPRILLTLKWIHSREGYRLCIAATLEEEIIHELRFVSNFLAQFLGAQFSTTLCFAKRNKEHEGVQITELLRLLPEKLGRRVFLQWIHGGQSAPRE